MEGMARQVGLNDEQKVLRYQYDVEKNHSQIYTSNGIESEAIRLLDSLLRCQQADNEDTRGTRRFVFVMLDIGGIIVKKVLEPRLALAENLSINLSARHFPSPASTRLDTKLLNRTLVCNIVSDIMREIESRPQQAPVDGQGDNDEDEEKEVTEQIAEKTLSDNSYHNDDPVFVKNSGRALPYYAAPYEITYKSSLSLRASNYLNFQMQTKYLRLVHSQAPPIHPADPARLERLPANRADRILNSTIYKSWSDLKGLAVLHLHGTANVSDISQAVVERLNEASGSSKKGRKGTLYFQFRKDDPRFCNLQAMLAFLLSAKMNRRDSTDELGEPNELERAYHFRGWSLDDQLDVLALRTWSLSNSEPFMISRLDDTAADARISSDTGTEPGTPGIIDCNLNLTKDAQDLLYCVQYAIRPMSVEELAIMTSLRDQTNWSKDHQRILTRDTVESSNSQVYLMNNEVYPHNLPLSVESTTTNKAHGDLTRRCLQYLQDPAVQVEIKAPCDTYDPDGHTPIPLLRHNLITYAVMHWPLHYRLAGDSQPLNYVSEFFQDPRNRLAWSCAYYTFGNPVTRSPRSYFSPIPLFSMLGLDDMLTESIRTESGSPTLNIDARLALVEAARYGHSTTVKLLMGTTIIDNSTLRDAVDAAASFGLGGAPTRLRMRLALQQGANINCKSGAVSPLYLAVLYGNFEIARMLLEKGLDPNENPEGSSLPLLLALELGPRSIKMLGLLLDHGARIEEENTSTEYRRTALARAAGKDDVNIVKYLLKRGADVNHAGKNSHPPIYAAAWSGNIDSVRVLLKAGADANALMVVNNWRPVISAYNNPKIIRLLLKNGADMNAISDDGTCLHIATLYDSWTP
uniref:Ankyrin repeat domain-containing protein 50 n=1 Tax=Talaromyces marneffei PM1 TaxID=1077442 RepID=A0A093VID1_TALMA